jgi:hypothetical protein
MLFKWYTHGRSLGWNFTEAGDWRLSPPEAFDFGGGGGVKVFDVLIVVITLIW